MSKKEKFKKIVDMDVRKHGIKKLKIALTKTKWLNKYEPDDINTDILEELYKKISKKYKGYISFIQYAGDNSWSIEIRHSKTCEWIYRIYGLTLFECMAKVILVCYGFFKLGINFKDENTRKGVKNKYED